MLRILCVTDLHGRLAALARILAHAGPADAILLGGDITHFGSPIDAEKVVELARQGAPTVLAVAGNCDSAAIDRRLVEMGVSLHARGCLLGSVGLHGLSATPPWKKGMYQLTEEEMASALETGHAQIEHAPHRVLLAHVPPHGTRADHTLFWQHAGSTAVRRFIETAEPALVFCGHIHEGRTLERLGHSLVVNCGHGAVGAYAWAEISDAVTDDVKDDVKAELRSA